MYDPSIGRWLEEDPIGFEGGDANLYRYVGNDPTNETDPTGKQAFALTGTKADEMVNQLRTNGVDAVAVPLGDYAVSGYRPAPLYLIVTTGRALKRAKSPLPMNEDANNARSSFNNNKVFFKSSDIADLEISKLTSEQQLKIFKTNLALTGDSPPFLQMLKNTVGYEEFKDQGWKQAGLGAVFAQLVLEHGNEGLKLLEFALAKKVRIESDNDTFWFTEKEYGNGRIRLAESKRRGLKRATTVEEAANYLYKLLKDNKENIEEWANRNYNDPTSAAQMSDHMSDPHTGAAMPLHVGGSGGLAHGFDDALSEAADQIQGLMFEYALAGLNVQASAAARAAALERGGLWTSQGRNVVMRDARAGADVARKLGERTGLLKGVFNGEMSSHLFTYLPEARVIKQAGADDCTVAAARMFLESRGIDNISHTLLIHELQTVGRGAKMTEVYNVLKKVILPAPGRRNPFLTPGSNIENLAHAVEHGPVIVGLEFASQGHAVVVDKVVRIPGSEKFMVAIRDPQFGAYALFQDDFLRLWSEREYISFLGVRK